MIKVENVSMKFNLGIEASSFKEKFIGLFDKKRRNSNKKNEFWALKDVSFEVKKGEVVGIIGSNGAGKSTLLKVISGVMKPTQGNVKVCGVISPMIELGAGFDAELTARENIYLNGSILGYSKEFIDEKFDEIVEFSELKKFLDVPVKNFSSGMTAKLAFSIATVVNPEILIVDEILSVGDIKFQEKSRNKMMEMIKGGTTVLYVSHSLESIKELCTKVVWIEHGVIQKIGNSKEICKEYHYKMLYGNDDGEDKSITINSIKTRKNVIDYDYSISNNLSSLFNIDNKLKIEYSDDISKVPYEIAVIPFLTGILPMIFLEDIKVYVDKIDKDFYESIPNIRNAYKKMLPNGNWNGEIIADKIIDHSMNSKQDKYSLYYSGGLDSTSSLVSVLNKKPEIISLLGSDIMQNDTKGWNVAKEMTKNISSEFDLKHHLVSSNFRFYINENVLTTKYRDLLPTSWWYDVQHGVGLLGHFAPIAFLSNIKTHFNPATHNINTRKDVVCASMPDIDESIHFCGCNIIHEGFELNRVQKVDNIKNAVHNYKGNIKLRVCCVQRDDKLNCCKCEKCYRTILEIMSCREDPKDYGFNITKNEIKHIKDFLDTIEIQDVDVSMWKDVQNRFIADKEYFKENDTINWIYSYNFDDLKIKDYTKEVWNENGEKDSLDFNKEG